MKLFSNSSRFMAALGLAFLMAGATTAEATAAGNVGHISAVSNVSSK